MKTKKVTAIIVGIICGSAYAESNPNSLSPDFSSDSAKLSLSAGVLQGKSIEKVYYPYTDYKISELDWKIKNLPILKLDYSWDAYSNITFNAKGWLSLTEGVGYMDDYDWEENPNWANNPVSTSSNWTDHSWHPNTNVNYGNEFDLNVKFWLFKNNKGKFGVVAGYQESRFSWTAYGGNYNYDKGTDVGSFPDGERVGGYSTRYTMPYIGLNGGFKVGDFEINGLIKFSNQVTLSDQDEHYLRSLTLYAKSTDSTYYGGFIDIGYYFNPNTKIFVEYAYNKYEEGRGNRTYYYYNTGSSTTYSGGTAGLSNINKSISIGLQYQF